MKGMTMEQQLNFTCAKCGSGEYETDEFRVKGGTGKLFDVRSKLFTAITCKRCHYTELYRGEITALGDMFDSFVG